MEISTGRTTEADEVADLVAFLASPRAANITGAEFVIDSGQIKSTWFREYGMKSGRDSHRQILKRSRKERP